MTTVILNENILFNEIKAKLNNEEFQQLKSLIQKENKDSILARLGDKNLENYLNTSIKSNFLHLYVCKNQSEIIGYALVADKPKYLISEFLNLKTNILIDLLLKFKISTLINVAISFLNLDLILVSKVNRNLIHNNPNLNLLAINVNFRSKGIGKEFMKKIFETFLDKNKETYFTCETYSENAKNFYIKKLKFDGVGKKLRLFKSMYILIKKI